MSDARATEQWWAEVSTDPEKMIKWLKDQYHGELTAAGRIRDVIRNYPEIRQEEAAALELIASQEIQHAIWVGALLDIRGIPKGILNKEARYWNKVLPAEKIPFKHMMAIGYHAETMRLGRIELLRSESKFADIAFVFTLILKDELMHQRVFGDMAGPEAIEAMRSAHEEGLNALGLVV